MSRRFRMALGLAVVLVAAGRVEAQGWRVIDPAPQPYLGSSQSISGFPAASAQGAGYGRRAASGGLIETAARRINPFAAPWRASNVAFAPQVYRQPQGVSTNQVRRPFFGTRGPGYRLVQPSTPLGVPATGPIPGADCPTCP
ncbi:hypothetical protein AB1L88_14870 [Tautonia sp. JC769]|uniref:hypothetical protein n=1 Tax=Tautonia sp. JC769 TaxID=3232135 RepID=UPI00345A6B53